MIIEQHYDDESLIGLMEEAGQDPHVPACETCAGTLGEYRELTDALHDDSVWDDCELPEKPAPQVMATLRSFAATAAAEDAAALPIVAKLVAASPEERKSLLEQNPGWRTAGVVRKVVAAITETMFADPKRAVELSGLAVEIAQTLEPVSHALDTVTKLHATALRLRAYALYYTGSYAESLNALEQTDDLLRVCMVAEYDSARARLMRAQVYMETERLEEALALADSAHDVFRRFGDIQREAAARSTKGLTLMAARRFTEALSIHKSIASDARVEKATRVISLHNAAICHRELSQLAEAKALFAEAVVELRHLGLASVCAKARWHLAQVLLAERQFEQSLSLAAEVRHEFEELGMAQDVALVAIDAAEALLMLGRYTQVVHLCQASMEYFAKAGLAYTQGALTALAYLQEAAKAGTLTPAALADVRAFFEILPKQPQLLFAQPA